MMPHFLLHTTERLMYGGYCFQGRELVDSVLRTYIDGDGIDATEKIVEMVNNSRNLDQLGVIMLDGITFGGFNLVNIKRYTSQLEYL